MKNRKIWITTTAILSVIVALLVLSRRCALKPEAQQSAPTPAVPAAQTVPQPAAIHKAASAITGAESAPSTTQLPAELQAVLKSLPPPVSEIRNADGSVTWVYKPEMMWTSKLGHGYFDQTLAGLADAQLKNIGMSRDQAFQAQEIYNRAVTNRLNIERAIAEVKPISARESLITVPEYSRGLEETLYSDLKGILGEKIAGNIRTQLGFKIRVENGGFGEKSQEIQVTAADGRWDVLHSVAFNDSSWSTTQSTLRPKDTSRYQALLGLFPPLPGQR